MNKTFNGYIREDGQVGARNYVAVVPTVVCVTEVVEGIVSRTNNTRGYFHHQGCCQLPPDLKRVTDTLIGLSMNPNVGAVLLVSLGCEGTDVDRLYKAVADSGKPVRRIDVQKNGGTSNAIRDGINAAQELELFISDIQREPVDVSKIVMGIKCGASDTTSGVASNMVIGYLADKIVDFGGTVIFGETTEFIGAEHILKRRAINKEVADDIQRIVDEMEMRAKSLGVDMREGQPTPGNIKGGLTTIEEKSLGAINKSGSRPIQGVLEYWEKPPYPGLWIKDTPGREPEILTGMASGGVQFIAFSTGRGAPQGFPTVPIIKICGNPLTYDVMNKDMDINAGKIILGEKSIEEVGEETFEYILELLSGKVTKAEAINYTTTMDIFCLGPVI